MSMTIKKTIFKILIALLCFPLSSVGQEMEAFVPQGYSLIPPATEAAAQMSYIETPWGGDRVKTSHLIRQNGVLGGDGFANED